MMRLKGLIDNRARLQNILDVQFFPNEFIDMFLTFDSNILISDFHLKSELFKLILNNYHECGYKLLISEIVTLETINKYEEELRKFNEVNKRNFYVIPASYIKPILDEEIEEIKQKYTVFLEKTFERSKGFSHGVGIYGFHTIRLEKIFQKALKKRKPFGKNEKGFRDALLWDNIVEMVRSYYRTNMPVKFITENYKDFCSDQKDSNGAFYVHDELKKDLMDIKHPEDSVVIYTSLKHFYESEFSVMLSELNDLKLNKGIDERLLRSLIKNNITAKNGEIFIKFKSTNEDLFGESKLIEVISAKIEDAIKSWVDFATHIRVAGSLIIEVSGVVYSGEYLLHSSYFADTKVFEFEGAYIEIFLLKEIFI